MEDSLDDEDRFNESCKLDRFRYQRPGGEPEALARLLGNLFFGKYNTKHAAVSAMAWQGLGKAVLARFVVAGIGARHPMCGHITPGSRNFLK